MRDGDAVYYSGRGALGADVGDQGQVLAVVGSAAHVKWLTGARTGQLTLEDIEDLEPRRAHARHELDDNLELGAITVHSARQVYDEGGAEGVLEMMASEGHLAMMVPMVEQALEAVAHRVRHDPALMDVAASLDDDEFETVVRVASAALVREALNLEGS